MPSAARAIHLKPVSVSRYCAPAAAAIFDSSVEDTMLVATSGCPALPSPGSRSAASRWRGAS